MPGFVSSITYHPNGLFHQIAHTSGVTYTQGADPSGMRRPGRFDIAGISLACPNSAADFTEGGGLAYEYDGAGNPKRIGDERYVYDLVGRVMKGWVGPSAGGENSQAYTYDPFGNIRTIATTRDGVEETRTLAVTAATNRLTGAGIGYDVVGNQTGWVNDADEWDAFGMMKRMTGAGNSSIYVYTADDERLWTIDYSVTPWRQRFTLRDLDGSVLRVFAADADYNGPWTVEQDYIRRDGALLATVKIGESGQAETWHQHPDHLGTPRMQTSPRNGSNQVCSIFNSYFPFGERLTPTLPADRMQFTGHERDVNGEGETDDLDYMHARYCSPLTGRFLSIDPSESSADKRKPQTWNRYSYTNNNPVLLVDPTGENAVVSCDYEGRCVVKVEAQIVVEAPNGEQLVAAALLKSGAENYWNSQTVPGPNGEKLTFDVTISIVKAGEEKSGIDTLTMVTGAGKSEVAMTLRRGTNEPSPPDSGPLYSRDQRGGFGGLRATGAHEVGHLMGLPDMYSKTGEAIPFDDSPQADIMKNGQLTNSARSAAYVLARSNGNTVVRLVQ